MKKFTFNTDGNSKEIANIVVQELQRRDNEFDLEKIEHTEDGGGNDMLILHIIENDLENEESFSHEICVYTLDVHEYSADLTLVY